MNFNVISSVAIYGIMFVFLYACINPGGIGLIRLHRLSQDLRSAATQLKDGNFCSKLERRIRGGSPNAEDSLFSSKVLSEQMKQYCDSISDLELNRDDKCRTDIDEYINYDLLHYQGRVDLCEHTASGFTALGLLGTFLGIAFGLASLGRNDSQQIITGIDGLLDGMGLAFLTSIMGIILSLVLGTALRLILAAAESNLELFLTRFRSNVMRNQSEAALNEIIQQITSIKSGLDTANEIQVSNLDRTVSAFVAKLNKEMGLQIGFLQSAIQDMSREQHEHSNSIRKLTTQLNTMAKSLENASNSFQPVMSQSNALSEQIRLASQSLKTSIDEIHKLLADDANALSQHQQLIAELLQTSEAMQNMSSHIQTQSAALNRYYQNMSSEYQKELNQTLSRFTQSSNSMIDYLTDLSVKNMNALQHHADELIGNMPQRGFSNAKLEQMLQQNQAIIEQQAKLIRVMEDHSRRTSLRWIRRTTK